MKEIGGYIEFETNFGQEFHENSLALNCGRNCISYLLRNKKINKLYIPFFCCDSVSQPCKRNNVPFEYYYIDERFRPLFKKELLPGEFLYIVNFYGQIPNKELLSYKKKYTKQSSGIIIDNAQAFFQKPLKNTDTLYTCRKFFGVADGAYLYTEKSEAYFDLAMDESFTRMSFLMGRFERSASEFYGEYVSNNKLFFSEPEKKMSELTHNLLRGIDYKKILRKRTENFKILHKKLQNINKLNLKIPHGAFMYPLYLENGDQIRKKLQENKIYIPTLWPDVFEICKEGELEFDYAKNILPLPCDQRYGSEDMEYLCNEILKWI